MKITYKDDATKKYIYSWLNSCTDPLMGYKVNDITVLRPNQVMVNKGKLLKRIIMETNCFNEDIDMLLALGYTSDTLKQPFVSFLTSEGETGTMDLHSGGYDSRASISIMQGEQERIFIYDYIKNPAMYNGNLLREYSQTEERKNIK